MKVNNGSPHATAGAALLTLIFVTVALASVGPAVVAADEPDASPTVPMPPIEAINCARPSSGAIQPMLSLGNALQVTVDIDAGGVRVRSRSFPWRLPAMRS